MASRRWLLQRMFLGLALVGIGAGSWAMAANGQARTNAMQVYRDPSCSCCHVWNEIVGRAGPIRSTLQNDLNMPLVKRRLGVPADLASCHTATVDGFVIEGHVPVTDIIRLLTERPSGIRGLAVPGMPRGSPGMEQPNGARDAFDVIALHADGSRTVFNHYPRITH